MVAHVGGSPLHAASTVRKSVESFGDVRRSEDVSRGVSVIFHPANRPRCTGRHRLQVRLTEVGEDSQISGRHSQCLVERLTRCGHRIDDAEILRRSGSRVRPVIKSSRATLIGSARGARKSAPDVATNRVGSREDRIVLCGGNNQIAGQCDFESATQCVSLDCGNQRRVSLTPNDAVLTTARHAKVGSLTDIGAGAKDVGCSGDDADPQRGSSSRRFSAASMPSAVSRLIALRRSSRSILNDENAVVAFCGNSRHNWTVVHLSKGSYVNWRDRHWTHSGLWRRLCPEAEKGRFQDMISKREQNKRDTNDRLLSAVPSSLLGARVCQHDRRRYRRAGRSVAGHLLQLFSGQGLRFSKRCTVIIWISLRHWWTAHGVRRCHRRIGSSRIFEDFALQAVKHPRYLRMVTTELERDFAASGAGAAHDHRFHVELLRIVTAGIEAGEVRSDYPPLFLAQMIGGVRTERWSASGGKTPTTTWSANSIVVPGMSRKASLLAESTQDVVPARCGHYQWAASAGRSPKDSSRQLCVAGQMAKQTLLEQAVEDSRTSPAG